MENEKRSQEQTEQKQEPERNTPQGWKDVVITPDMPLAAMVQFFNVLNQRLCTIEDNTFVEMPTGEKLSITQIYALQAQEEQKAQEEQNKEQQGE